MDIKSKTMLKDWRGHVTLFAGFYNPLPGRECAELSWDDTEQVVARGNAPMLEESKDDALYFVSCALKTAPYVGKTREKAIENGWPLEGTQRSADHVTEAQMIVVDIDSASQEQFEQIQQRLSDSGVTYLIYSTHSHGREDKPGIRCRLIVPVDESLEKERYKLACLGIDEFLGRDNGDSVIDRSGFGLHQQQGVWCTACDRAKLAFKLSHPGGVVSGAALIALAPKRPVKRFDGRPDHPIVFIETKVRAAMKCLDLREYDAWCQSALWLKSAYGDAAKSVWLDFSKPGKYDAEAFWDDLDPRLPAGAGEGLLFRDARDAAVEIVNQAKRTGEWGDQARHALSYLRAFHPRMFCTVTGRAA